MCGKLLSILRGTSVLGGKNYKPYAKMPSEVKMVEVSKREGDGTLQDKSSTGKSQNEKTTTRMTGESAQGMTYKDIVLSFDRTRQETHKLRTLCEGYLKTQREETEKELLHLRFMQSQHDKMFRPESASARFEEWLEDLNNRIKELIKENSILKCDLAQFKAKAEVCESDSHRLREKNTVLKVENEDFKKGNLKLRTEIKQLLKETQRSNKGKLSRLREGNTLLKSEVRRLRRKGETKQDKVQSLEEENHLLQIKIKQMQEQFDKWRMEGDVRENRGNKSMNHEDKNSGKTKNRSSTITDSAKSKDNSCVKGEEIGEQTYKSQENSHSVDEGIREENSRLLLKIKEISEELYKLKYEGNSTDENKSKTSEIVDGKLDENVQAAQTENKQNIMFLEQQNSALHEEIQLMREQFNIWYEEYENLKKKLNDLYGIKSGSLNNTDVSSHTNQEECQSNTWPVRRTKKQNAVRSNVDEAKLQSDTLRCTQIEAKELNKRHKMQVKAVNRASVAKYESKRNSWPNRRTILKNTVDDNGNEVKWPAKIRRTVEFKTEHTTDDDTEISPSPVTNYYMGDTEKFAKPMKQLSIGSKTAVDYSDVMDQHLKRSNNLQGNEAVLRRQPGVQDCVSPYGPQKRDSRTHKIVQRSHTSPSPSEACRCTWYL